ncbi:MAG: hypothetical protein JOZ82_08420 [Marmoricola sp.]|nr:hypothetical protein [Marmoricola sp.]
MERTLARPLLEPTTPVVVVPANERGSRDLACRHLAGVSSLLESRSDLRGVHAWADVVEESVRWSA